MSAGNRKNPQRPNYTGRDILADQKKQHTWAGYLAVLMIVAIVGILIGAGFTKANAASPSPVKQANCWHHGKVDDILFVHQGEDIQIDFGSDPLSLHEFWCRKNDFTAEILVANDRKEGTRLYRWFRLTNYQNTTAFCEGGNQRSYTITDLEDYPKARTEAQTRAYNTWVKSYAARNDCLVK